MTIETGRSAQPGEKQSVPPINSEELDAAYRLSIAEAEELGIPKIIAKTKTKRPSTLSRGV